jgi:hypothetical protein
MNKALSFTRKKDWAILTGKEGVWTSTTFWCVPSTHRTRRSLQDKVKLAYAFWLMQPTLAQEEDMHQFIGCQIATGIHCSTEHAEYHHCSTSRRGEEPSARFSSTSSTTTRTPWWSVCTLIFLISDKVHIYSGEGRKTAAQHVMMISLNHARIYLGLRASPSVCSRSSSLSRNGELAILPSIEIGLLTLLSHMSVIC